MIRPWMVIAPAALAALAAVVIRRQERKFAADLAGRDRR